MEKGEKNQRGSKISESDLFLKWGNRKRLRCVRARDRQPQVSSPYGGDGGGGCRLRRKNMSRFDTYTAGHQTTRLTRNSEAAGYRSENRKSSASSPEKEDKHYTTRGSAEENGGNGKMGVENGGAESKGGGAVWPKLYITLSSKEKEEDFMAMKGCKLPQRPKKRAKIIQRTLLLVSPGAWLTDMCQERYEVREKKTTKKKGKGGGGGGLKAMGNVESDSD